MNLTSQRLARGALVLAAGAVVLSGCSSASSSTNDGGDVSYVEGATFTMALSGDPGNLDPQSSASTNLFTISQLAYDPLLSVDAKTGQIQSQLASEWSVDGTTVSLTLGKGITCADSSAFTASDVVANIGYVADPKNQSPFLGTFLPVGTTAKGDDAAGTVTLTLAQPAPFVLNGLASLPMICQSGLKDRAALASKTQGTGPFQLTEAAPGDHYTYQVRQGYTWGPGGATTAQPGVPAKVVMKVVENEATRANLLLSGGLNAAAVQGPDVDRLDKAGLFVATTTALTGEQWYNHGSGHATSTPAVRTGLTQALDLAQLQSVITAGKGGPATTLAAIEPVACPGDSVAGNVPAQDVAAATTALAGAPALTFVYDSSGGSAVAAAAELAVQQWQAAGVTVKGKALDQTALQQTIFGGGDWDIAWVPLNLNSPDQLVPFLSGPGPADGGTNFSGIANASYDSQVKKASAMTGTEGCPTWLQAESSLFTAADIVPFANNLVKTFGNGAEFQTPGQLVPTSIRMVAK